MKMCHEKEISRRRGKGLAKEQIGLVIKPQQSIYSIKTEGELSYRKA